MTTETTTNETRSPSRTTPEFTQARVRLNQDGAQLVWRLILAEETRLLTNRRQADDATRAMLQDELKSVRRVKDELERTLYEQGWYD